MAFQPRLPPFPVRCGLGIVMHGIMGPMIKTLEAVGRADRMMAAMVARQKRQREKNNPFRKYVPTEHDVFVATFAKSGTNWMMQIAHQLANHGKAEYQHIHSVVPWPDASLAPPLRKYCVPVDDPSVWMASLEQKRVIKTHFDWGMFPYSEKARYIMVIRDPKDIFVSSYFFIKEGVFGRAMPSVETWYKLFLSEDFLLGGSWAANTAGYWAQHHRPNVLICSFKSMKRDLRATVIKVAEFMNVAASEETIDLVCEKSSFEYMKAIDQKFYMGKIIPWMSGGQMMRKGKQGASAELLSAEQQRHVDAHCRAELKRLGSDFPYEEFCDLAP